MNLSVRTFCIPKAGNYPWEYEDACAYDLKTGRFAMADGAAESSFAQLWANLLTEGFVRPLNGEISPQDLPWGNQLLSHLETALLPQWLAPLQAEWRQAIPWDRLPYYAEEKALRGAYATFLGVKISDFPGRWGEVCFWRAFAWGDCCLFQVHQGHLITSFAVERSRDFTNAPVLLCSLAVRNRLALTRVVSSAARGQMGRLWEHDLILLTTDALGQWFLAQSEAGGRPWEELASLAHQEDFAAFITARRKEKSLRNDDTSLMVIQVAGP